MESEVKERALGRARGLASGWLPWVAWLPGGRAARPLPYRARRPAPRAGLPLGPAPAAPGPGRALRSVSLNDACAVGLLPARAAAPARAQADPVRRRRAEQRRQGLGRRRRPLGAYVPGRLRGRRAEPGHPDSLRDPERARRRARRAQLLRLARPRGPDAPPRRAAVHRRRAPAGPSLRRARGELFAPSSATPTCSPRWTWPGYRSARPAAPRPTPWCWPGGMPRSTPSRSPSSSTAQCSATASRPCWPSPT